MKDEEIEKVYNNFAKFYLEFVSKCKLTFDMKDFDKIFIDIIKKDKDYDLKQVRRVIKKKYYEVPTVPLIKDKK